MLHCSAPAACINEENVCFVLVLGGRSNKLAQAYRKFVRLNLHLGLLYAMGARRIFPEGGGAKPLISKITDNFSARQN